MDPPHISDLTLLLNNEVAVVGGGGELNVYLRTLELLRTPQCVAERLVAVGDAIDPALGHLDAERIDSVASQRRHSVSGR